MQLLLIPSYIFCISIVSAQADSSSVNLHVSDGNLQNSVEDCLADTGLNINILGINKINDLQDTSFENLWSVVEDKRNCFMACVFKKRGFIDLNGNVTEDISLETADKKLASTVQNAVTKCKAEKNFCKLGGCLFDAYF